MNLLPGSFRSLGFLWFVGMIVCAPLSHPASAQNSDGGISEEEIEAASNLPEGHSPKGALWRSIAVPGWGQYYNGHILKIPVVYAGLVGIASFTVFTNDQYYRFRNIYRYAQEPEQYPQYADLAAPFEEEIQSGRTERLRRARERFRRYRDLSIVGFFGFYAFSVLDAYVSAHLLHFDVDEDLSIRVHGDHRGPGATLRWQF